jgi:CcmD family protein
MQSQTNPGTVADPGSRSTEFVPVQGGGETTSAANLLITAYVVMWALLLGFIFVSWRRQGRVETRISELEKALTAGGSKASARD